MLSRALLPIHASSPSAAETDHRSGPILDFLSSTDTLDRYQEIIDPAGWRLDSYRRNPVFQNAHNYGDILFTLGKALITEIRQVAGRQALFQRIQFATDVNPIARIAHGLYSGGFLNAVSVGFIPLRWQDPDGAVHTARDFSPTAAADSFSSPEGERQREQAPLNPSSQASLSEVAGRQARRKYLEQELLEVSAVAIPANPDALALALKSGAIPKSDLHETLDLLRCLTHFNVAPNIGGAAADKQYGGAMPEGSRGSQRSEAPRITAPNIDTPLSPRGTSGERGRAEGHLQPPTCNLQLITFARELRRILRRA